MPTRRQLIQKITLNADATSITFSNIPQNYTDILLVASQRNSGANAGLAIRLNNDSGANYTYRVVYGNGASAGAFAQTVASNYNTYWFCYTTPDNATANTFGSTQLYIPNYSTSINKSCFIKSIGEDNNSSSYISSTAGLWSSTASITSITILSDPGGNVSGHRAKSTFYLYGITQVPIIRGGEVSVRDGFKYHTFRSSGSIQVIEPGEAECLVVAGGGGGGSANADFFAAAGGGAGGFVLSRSKMPQGISQIVVGSGGAGGASSTGNPGSNSSISGLFTALGGGWGAGDSGGWSTGLYGSGGGTVQGNPASTVDGTQGNNGGTGSNAGGGGGGAGAIGGNGTTTGGNGGIGRQFPTNGQYYSGGGGGGTASYYTSNPGGLGGQGGGGTGGAGTIDSTAGQVNTGGGGGGGGANTSLPQRNGAAGGSGIVIIRYPYDGN